MQLLGRARELEKQGHCVVHFEVGEPDFVTAEPIVAAAHSALDAGFTGYTQALGLPELRQAIADDYTSRHNLSIPAERIVVTTGASGGLLLLMSALLNPGEEILLTDPGYPCNANFAQAVGAHGRALPVDENSQFQLTAQHAASEWREQTRGILLASPANPTGSMIPRSELKLLGGLVAEKGGFLLLDEIYQGLHIGKLEYQSGLQVVDNLFVINSFSKYFGMTGWRLGWLVIPEFACAAIEALAQNLFISPPSIAQHAALAAFSPEAMRIHESRRQEFVLRQECLRQGLLALGFRIPVYPEGAFYLYVDISHTAMDAETFCWRLIEEFHVAVTPGTDFGSHCAQRFVRFAFTTGLVSVELGLQRIAAALEKWSTE